MIFVALLGLLVGFLLFGLSNRRDNEETYFAGIGIIGLSVLTVLASCFTIVPSGSVGVQRLFGKIYDEEIREGFSLLNPFTSVSDIKISVQQFKESHEAETSDTQTVHVDTITNISLDPNMVAENVRAAGEDFVHKYFQPVNQESVRAQISKHKVTDLISQRSKVREDIYNSMSLRLKEHGIILGDMALSAVDFSDKYDAAIEEKQVEEQTIAKRVYELQSRQQEALIAETVAKGKANAVIEEARGEAESLRLRGLAQSEYNDLVAKSLTPLLISHGYLTRWNGTLPSQLMGSDSLNVLLGVGK